jgi:hypothetical protein
VARRGAFFDERRFNPDVVDVLEAAATLEVTEFELFRIAYRRWHGDDDATDDVIERYYLPYMFGERVPAFVRHLTREVLARAEEGRLDPKDFGVMPRQLTMDMYNRGLRYVLWLVIIFGSALSGAIAVAELTPWYQSCYLPPCY